MRILQVSRWFSPLIHQFLAFTRRLHSEISQRLAKLTIAQKLYLLALFSLPLYEDHPALPTLLTVSALIIEFWPLFNKLWHSLAGKAMILLFYATIANFSLASSGAIVNEVTGVSAAHFNYTHNFALLLELPVWMVITSSIALLLLQMLLPFYLAGLLLLKLVGLIGFKWQPKYAYPVSTAFVRLTLSFLILHHLMLLIDMEHFIESRVRLDDDGVSFSFNGQFKPDNKQLSNTNQSKADADNTDHVNLKDETHEGNAINEDNADRPESVKAEEEAAVYSRFTAAYRQKVRQLVADFAFGMEADGRSRCQLAESAHAVELNDYELLQIQQDHQTLYGYRFEVIPCISPAFPITKTRP
ncbi:hypothetical protein LZ659_00905 [Shewanella indica]|uniref:hypothetical protein n=1 Tax=Shewanella indica TaxID=768528 RepID=UPI001F166AEF|nr:hypothetical protein [Shewanella indica]MCE9790176.1 hypothetical protein [Shewanella indica]